MAALTQNAWHEDRYPAGGETPALRIRQTAHRRAETRSAAIRFIQSQIGAGAFAAPATQSPQVLDRIEF